jgi:hypothetical protein
LVLLGFLASSLSNIRFDSPSISILNPGSNWRRNEALFRNPSIQGHVAQIKTENKADYLDLFTPEITVSNLERKGNAELLLRDLGFPASQI